VPYRMLQYRANRGPAALSLAGKIDRRAGAVKRRGQLTLSSDTANPSSCGKSERARQCHGQWGRMIPAWSGLAAVVLDMPMFPTIRTDAVNRFSA